MKKLILPLMVSIVLVMFFDLKSEPLVQPNDNSILLLAKPSIVTGAFCYNDQLCVSWNSLGGTYEYRVSYWSPQGYLTSFSTVPIKHGQKSYSIQIDVSLWPEGSYVFMVEALNRKGDVKSSSQVNVTVSHPEVTK